MATEMSESAETDSQHQDLSRWKRLAMALGAILVFGVAMLFAFSFALGFMLEVGQTQNGLFAAIGAAILVAPVVHVGLDRILKWAM